MSKKKSESKRQEEANESAGQDESQKLLHMEYDTLTENLVRLKRRAEQLRKENEFLQNEVAETRIENKEYIFYLTKRAEKRKSAIATLSDQSHQELDDLRKQRQKMQDKHEEQTNELQGEILQMENQLAKLNNEIADLKDVKTLQQQQLCRIAELERELTAMQSHHTKSLVALKADFIREKKSCEQQAEDKVQAFTVSANKTASHSLMSYMNEVFQENNSLRKELENLFQRVHALLRQQETLQTHQRRLLLERDYMQKIHAQRVSQCSKYTTPAGVNNKEHPQRDRR